MISKPAPRGVRNRNPGNLDRTATVWQGEDRSPDALRRESRFCVFVTDQAGLRALGKTLLTYQRKHSLRTVSEIISRWAPPNENNTPAYVALIAREISVGPNEIIDLAKPVILVRLVTAIARHENGGLFWPATVIEAGVREALG